MKIKKRYLGLAFLLLIVAYLFVNRGGIYSRIFSTPADIKEETDQNPAAPPEPRPLEISPSEESRQAPRP